MSPGSDDLDGDVDGPKRQASILAAAVRVEKYGIEYYTDLSECVRDEVGKRILKGLAKDENQHRAWLEKQIDHIFPGKEDINAIEPDQKYANITPQSIFPLPKSDVCLALKDEIKAVEAAIEIEEASVQMYMDIAEMARDPNLKMMMQRLSQWEQGHKNILEESLHYLKQGGSWYGYTPILDG